MKSQADDWTLLSWQGVGFEIPADWSLAAATGDRKKGGLRVEDELLTRLEVAWQRVSRKRTLDRIVDEVTRRFRRNARKRRQAVSIEEASLKLRRRDYRLLRCRSDVESLNLIYRCERCRKAVVATLYPRPGERAPKNALARRIFDSLYDHARGKRDVWSAYGVRLEVPTDYELANSALRAGLVDLTFIRRDWQITLVRSALAEVQLRERGLGQWFAAAYARRLRQYATTTERTTFRGHAALKVTGATKVARAILRPTQPRSRVYIRAWHCQVSDKLFIFHFSAPREAEAEFEDLLGTVFCH